MYQEQSSSCISKNNVEYPIETEDQDSVYLSQIIKSNLALSILSPTKNTVLKNLHNLRIFVSITSLIRANTCFASSSGSFHNNYFIFLALKKYGITDRLLLYHPS